MKALVKAQARPGLWLQEVPVPEVGINEVLVRVLRTAICGTDLHIYNWDAWASRTLHLPVVIGHEFAGEIVEVGSNVLDFRPGQIVSGEGHIVCGRCRNCMAGRRHLCAHARGIGVNYPGAFAEYIVLPMSNIWEHRPGIDLDIAAIFDPFGNSVHAALTFNLVGEDVLITGAGPIGLMACAVCRHAGARHIVITDINPARLALATQLGATRCVDVRSENLRHVQQDLGMTEGFDVGLEMSGSPEALQTMLGNLCHGGKLAYLGIPIESIAIDWTTVIFNMLTIRGIYGREMYETWYKMSLFIESGLDILPVISHRLHYSEYEQAFDIMRSGRASKVVLKWAEASEGNDLCMA